MPEKVYHTNITAAPKEPYLDGSAIRSVLVMNHATVSFVEVQPDFQWPDSTPSDCHDYDQMIIVMSGRLEMIVGGESFLLEIGDALYIPPDTPHYARLVDRELCRVIEIYAPVREDLVGVAANQIAR